MILHVCDNRGMAGNMCDNGNIDRKYMCDFLTVINFRQHSAGLTNVQNHRVNRLNFLGIGMTREVMTSWLNMCDRLLLICNLVAWLNICVAAKVRLMYII
jgi:hypothetical protein